MHECQDLWMSSYNSQFTIQWIRIIYFVGILRIRMFQLNIPAIHCVNLFPGISKTRKCPKLIVECIHDSHNMSDLGRRQRLIEHIVKWSFAAKSDFKFGQIRSPPHVCPIKKQSVWNLSILALCIVMQFCNCCIWKETMTQKRLNILVKHNEASSTSTSTPSHSSPSSSLEV